MKRLALLTLLYVFCVTSTQAQIYSFNNGFTNGQSITTCSGTFFDSSPNATYGTFENYSVTFSPGTANRVIQMIFTELAIGSGDTLFMYDGASMNNNLITSFTNTNLGSNISFRINPTDTNNSGKLTFAFKSDGVADAVGWTADIKCIFPCRQSILGNLTTNPAKDANGFINICTNANGTVQFNVTTAYPNNGTIYNQADSTSLFYWSFGDGKDTLKKDLTNISHTYTQEGGYNVKLVITDSNGCNNSLPIFAKVRTGITPTYSIVAPANLCVLDSVKISPSIGFVPNVGGSVSPTQGSFLSLPISGDSLFLPDGSGVTYSSSLVINQFNPGQTLTNINDLKGIFVTMEHSYLGDLNISITAPNGVVVNLKNYPGGADCYLGEPVDEDFGGVPPPPLTSGMLGTIVGKGYEYIFKNNANFGTMAFESTRHTQSYTDNSGRRITHRYLPPGSYLPNGNLSSLVGTTLNGTWTIKIKDNLAIDNGYLFNWKLDFNPSLFPNAEVYNVPIVSQNWVTPTTGLANLTGTIATIIPTAPGNLSYAYRVTDVYGCVFDTTVNINAIASPIKPNLGNDTSFCTGQNFLTLTVSNPDNSAFYTWNNGASGVAIPIATPGVYITIANNTFGCKSADTILVNTASVVDVNLGNDTMYCASKPNLLKPIVSSNVVGYLWNNGSTKDTLTITGPGTYSVMANTINGCTNNDEIIIIDNPVNTFRMPADTIICDKSSYLLTLTPPPNTSITWNDGFTGFTKKITANNTYSTIANNIGCLTNNRFTVSSKPLPIVNIGNDTTICNTKSVVVSAKYAGASFTWNDNSTDSFLLIKSPNTYWIEALLNQCTFRDSIEVKYKKCECETVIPNAFSPNGDNINDEFVVKMECIPSLYHITIFNRNGQIMFDSKDYTKRWNGTFNGMPLPIATYYYTLTYYNAGLQLPERFSGSITILR